ncbi:tetratricopeptide repeat protein 21B-like [Oscarella lobularis]|uniref:tetratricopeptide repeat protein 21B-like n=1 Tax=Oscarella lobularis TaxID=121494 RepID=UPI00331355D2
MAAADFTTLAKINYYLREKYYQHMQQVVLESLKKYGTDPVLVFWKAVGEIMEDRLAEGMRSLQTIKDKRDVILCSSMALVYAHKRCSTIDKEAVQELDTRVKQERQKCGEKALYFAGLFLWHTGRHDKAREYVDRMLKMSPGAIEGLVLRGWIDLTCNRDSYVKKSGKFFDEVLGSEETFLDALLGKAKYFETKFNYSGALECVNKAVVSYPGLVPALVEKMKLQLCLQEWEQSVETAQRILGFDSHCIDAVRMLILHMLCQEGRHNEAAAKLGDLIELVDRFEGKNHNLYYSLSKTFSRVSGRHGLVLQQTQTLVERALGLAPTNAVYTTELGYELTLRGKMKEAMKSYRNAMKLDETSVVALTGVISCQLTEGHLDDAEQQLDFLNEIQSSGTQSADLKYLSASLAQRKGQSVETVVALLNKTIEIHFASLKGIALSEKYFEKMNPDFLLTIVRDYLSFVSKEVPLPGQPPSEILSRCTGILSPLTTGAPGILEGMCCLAKVKFYSGNVEEAFEATQRCLQRDSTYADAHLLLAEIYLHEHNFSQASQSLEFGLSHNFDMKENPVYHLLKAKILHASGKFDEAVRVLNTALNIPGVRKPLVGQRKGKAMAGLADRVAIYLELAEVHRKLNQKHEAAKVMQDSLNEFRGTPEESKVIIANALLDLDRGDTDHALRVLRTIKPTQQHYTNAVEKMAHIYLYQLKDRRRHIACFQELVQKRPEPRSFLLLGDAYMNVQEPEQAIEVYETALKRDPRDGALARKIGKALIKTHFFSRAINYYETALRTGGQSFLRYDLAELHLKLKQYAKAEKTLQLALEQKHETTDLSHLVEKVRFLTLLARVYQQSGDPHKAIQSLQTAKETQNTVLSRTGIEQPDALSDQKTLMANICCQMADHSVEAREFDKAVLLYREALSHKDTDQKTMLALAKLFLSMDDLESCQHQCLTLLRLNKDNDAATVMMADLMFRKNEYDSAIFHFQQLLGRKPDHYEALVRLVQLLRKAGHLEECAKYVKQAEEASHRPSIDAGLFYCKGLIDWYQSNTNSALKNFNLARNDAEWSERATYNMIEICLNPDNETMGGETFESIDVDANERQDTDVAAVRTAENLLKDLKPKPGCRKFAVATAFTLVATKNKANVERALSQFVDIVANDRDHVPALYGMAVAYMVLKQTPRARNQLKRINKIPWNSIDGEEFEKSWLLLADIYIQSGKYDLATDLLKRCLQFNRSCWKANEYLGFIMEKEQSYKDAAVHYENAWKFGNKRNPAIGYKLAFNYLKAKRFVDAIDVCHKVLGAHPNYPKIRREILEKARGSVRA